MIEIHDPDEFESLPESIDELEEWIREYLNPEGEGHRAHKFICNVLTYPLVRDLHFAATPNPPHLVKTTGEVDVQNRVLSMISGICSTRPGDIIFFHQSERFGEDESLSEYFGYEKDSQARRGALGVYRILSDPFSDDQTLEHPDTEYEITGECPKCETEFAWMKGLNDNQVRKLKKNRGDGKLPSNGEIDRDWCPGSVLVSSQDNHSNPKNHSGCLMLPNRLILEPLAIFPQPIGDNRLYMDLADETIFWTGRTDSKMGPGKGSTTRHILPEEAEKLVRFLKDEVDAAGEEVDLNPTRKEYPTDEENLEEVKDHNQAQYRQYFKLAEDSDQLAAEFYLNLYFSLNADKKSSISQTLSDVYELKNLEYFSSEYPTGAAGDESDFLITFRKDSGSPRHRILHFEFKRGKVKNKTLAELMLYVPWIAQAMTQFSKPSVEEIDIVPILVGYEKTERKPHDLKRTEEYSFSEKYIGGRKIKFTVKPSRTLLYEPKDEKKINGERYTTDLDFIEVSNECKKVEWGHLKGLSKSDLDWVRKERWDPKEE